MPGRGRRRGHLEISARAVPRVHPSRCAELADRLDRARCAARATSTAAASPKRSRRDRRLNHIAFTKPPFRPLGPWPQRSASSKRTLASGSSRMQMPRGPHSRVAAADHGARRRRCVTLRRPEEPRSPPIPRPDGRKPGCMPHPVGIYRSAPNKWGGMPTAAVTTHPSDRPHGPHRRLRALALYIIYLLRKPISWLIIAAFMRLPPPARSTTSSAT